MKKFLFITTFVVLFFIPISVSADIIINEIMYDLEEGSDSGREWVEILNIGDGDVNLKDWRFNDGSNHILNEPPKNDGQGSLIIPTGEYAILTDDAAIFLANHSAFSNTVIDTVMNLKNTSATLKIIDSEGNEVDSVTYQNTWGANGDGRSLQRKDPEGNSNEPTNWGTGNPTPGTDNVIEKPEEPEEEPVPFEEAPAEAPPTTTGNNPPIARAGDNIIGFISQEIKFDGTQSSDPEGYELAYSWNMGDGKLIEKPSFAYKYLYPGTYLVTLMVYDGQTYVQDTITVKIQSQQITINEFIPNPIGKDEENEWIEIYNDSDSVVDISGWQLDDEEKGSNPFIFPENTLMAPKNYLVFSRQITGIALNNASDSVRLLLPEGIVFQEISYDQSKEGQSSAHTDEGFVWSVPSPGMANITGPPQSIGSLEKQFTFQQPIEPEKTKEPLKDYSWYFQSPEQEIEGGFTIQEPIISDKDDKDKFAAVSDLAPQKESKGNQETLNLILMIIGVVLAGLIIGFLLTKFLKKST